MLRQSIPQILNRQHRVGQRPGYALIAVLIVVVVLSLAAYRFADSMSAEYKVAVRTSEAAQSKAYAASGVHYAAGMLSDPEMLNAQLEGNPFNNPQYFSGIPLGVGESGPSGRFSLIAVADTGIGSGQERYQVRYGVLDEAAKLNINALIQLDKNGDRLHDSLMKLPNMTEEVADAIVDWVDADDTSRPSGAESAFYQGLSSPYLCKNGPLNSLEELLLVRGVTPYLLFGNDRNRNGRFDPAEQDGSGFSRGWAEFLTVYGRELNADSAGNAKVFLGDNDLAAMSEKLIPAIGQEMTDYILAARLIGTTSITQNNRTQSSGNTVFGGANELRAAVEQSMSSGGRARNRLNSVASLINTQISLPKPANAPANTPTVVVVCPLNDKTKLNELLPLLLDTTTTRNGFEMIPRVNVNTAPPEVLAAIPDMQSTDVDAILAARDGQDPTDLGTTTAAWLITDANITPDTFRKIERYITGKSMTYRVHSVGYSEQGGPFARVEAIIDTNLGHPRIVYYRDLTELGKGFELPK